MATPFKNPEKGSSLFGVLRQAQKPQPEPPPVPEPAAAAAPADAGREDKPAPAPPSGETLVQEALERRMAVLERQLRDTQERALAAEIRLREREEARSTAHREAEAIVQTSVAQHRSEEAFRQLHDQLAAGAKRIEDLETRIIEIGRAKENISKSEDLLRRLASEAESRLGSQAARFEALLRDLAAKMEAKIGESGLEALTRRVGEALKSIESKFIMNEGELAIARTQAALREAELKELRSEMERLRERFDLLLREFKKREP